MNSFTMTFPTFLVFIYLRLSFLHELKGVNGRKFALTADTMTDRPKQVSASHDNQVNPTKVHKFLHTLGFVHVKNAHKANISQKCTIHELLDWGDSANFLCPFTVLYLQHQIRSFMHFHPKNFLPKAIDIHHEKKYPGTRTTKEEISALRTSKNSAFARKRRVGDVGEYRIIDPRLAGNRVS